MAFRAFGYDTMLLIQALCAMTAASLGLHARKDPAMLSSCLLLATWILIGGAGGVAVWLLLVIPQGRRSRVSSDNASSTFAEDRAELLQNQLVDRRLRIEGAHAIRPLRDIFVTGTQAEKFRALSAIARRYSASLAPALRAALKDGDPAVRVLASSVMASLDARYLGRVRSAMALSREQPNDSRHWLELSEAFLAYANSGLLKADRRREATRKAQEYADRAAETDRSTVSSVGVVTGMGGKPRKSGPAKTMRDNAARSLRRGGFAR